MGELILKITIPVAPVTKKNSQQIVERKTRDKTGKIKVTPMIIPSKKYKEYERACSFHIPFLDAPIDRPVNCRCLYYMPTQRACDLVNLQEATLDVLTHYNIIADDNYKVIASMDGSRVFYDKDNPRTEVYIEELCDG